MANFKGVSLSYKEQVLHSFGIAWFNTVTCFNGAGNGYCIAI